MKKVLIVILLSTLTIKGQSKLFPNIGSDFHLEQAVVNNNLNISHPKHIITKVFLYNKATFERTTFENHSNAISVDLNQVEPGMYTTMVYTNGDIIVLKLKVVNDYLKRSIEPTEAVAEVEEKTLKFYRVVASINGTSVTRYNVFTEERKNELIKKNIFDITTYTGRRNTLVLSALYTDGSEEVVYETEAPNSSNLFKKDKDFAKYSDI
ncbi:hypothetical protein AAFN75_08125 [Algibacter sp. AS12]|uniref:hypothetical protein n=1 Tax=Algibacter sp. AS12 TaxID=3135773 RepID=UPI00398AB13F